jgi:hypothetical protein
MERFDVAQVLAQGLSDVFGKDCNAVSAPLAVAHDDVAKSEVDVLHSEASAFEKAQARSVEQARHELRRARQVSEYPPNLFAREHYGQVMRASRSNQLVDPRGRDAENGSIQEDEGA